MAFIALICLTIVMCVILCKRNDKIQKRTIAKLSLRQANLLLKQNERIRYLHASLTQLPKNETQIRQNQRSHIIRAILSETQDVDLTKAICALADIRSKRNSVCDNAKRK